LVAMAQAGDEDAGEAVDVALALAVGQANALALRENQRVFRELLHLHEIEKERGDDVLRAHDFLPDLSGRCSLAHDATSGLSVNQRILGRRRPTCPPVARHCGKLSAISTDSPMIFAARLTPAAAASS